MICINKLFSELLPISL